MPLWKPRSYTAEGFGKVVTTQKLADRQAGKEAGITWRLYDSYDSTRLLSNFHIYAATSRLVAELTQLYFDNKTQFQRNEEEMIIHLQSIFYGTSIFLAYIPLCPIQSTADTRHISLLHYDENYKAYHRPVLNYNVEFAWRPTEASIWFFSNSTHFSTDEANSFNHVGNGKFPPGIVLRESFEPGATIHHFEIFQNGWSLSGSYGERTPERPSSSIDR